MIQPVNMQSQGSYAKESRASVHDKFDKRPMTDYTKAGGGEKVDVVCG